MRKYKELEDQQMTKFCDECFWCLLIEEGYSNYTVEGITVHCVKEKNPGLPIDSFYCEDPAIAFATNCSEYFYTDTPNMVEVEEDNCAEAAGFYGDSAENRKLLVDYMTKNMICSDYLNPKR